MVQNLGKYYSLLNEYVAELRDVNIQKDSWRFRMNMERIGKIFAYEISKQLSCEVKEVQTPLGVADVPVMKQYPVIASILRAGMPFHLGFLEFFDKAENAFISAYRKHDKAGSFEIQLEYVTCPDLSDKILILIDPMLATGSSMMMVYNQLLAYGKPKHTHIVSILSSSEGIQHIEKRVSPDEVTLWTAAIDEELTAQSYIVPGLGDAGDLAFGKKLQD